MNSTIIKTFALTALFSLIVTAANASGIFASIVLEGDASGYRKYGSADITNGSIRLNQLSEDKLVGLEVDTKSNGKIVFKKMKNGKYVTIQSVNNTSFGGKLKSGLQVDRHGGRGKYKAIAYVGGREVFSATFEIK